MKEYRITKVEHESGHIYWTAERRSFWFFWVRVGFYYENGCSYVTHPQHSTYDESVEAIHRDSENRKRPIKKVFYVDPP